MAQSTAQELAQLLPHLNQTRARGLYSLLWKRNRGYLNRKCTSFLFDLLEVLSLAVLASIDSLKNLYLIWIIFYVSQGILESLFYSARKIYVYEKKLPSKKTLIGVHLLVAIIPFFFTFASFDNFYTNNIAKTYLFFKAASLTLQIFFNYINFDAQTLTRIYYPPMLNWVLLIGSFISIVIIQNFFGPAVSFYLVLTVIALAKLIQDLVILKKVRSLRASILWKIKLDKVNQLKSLIDFLTLISLEVFLSFSILSLPHKSINLKNMALIFLIYMIVKVFMRPIRSLLLDHWSIRDSDHKKLIIMTYAPALIISIALVSQTSTPPYGIYLGFTYFNLLVIWNKKLTDNKNILILNVLSLIWAILNQNLLVLSISHFLIFLALFYTNFKTPPNINHRKKIVSYENKFVLTFKERQQWNKMAQQYPNLIWNPIGKNVCIIDSKDGPAGIQKLVFNHSYEIKLIEELDKKLSAKLNLR